MEGAAKLEQYLLLAKGARGRAVADLILKVTAEPGIYAFGELLDVPSVKELRASDLAQAYKLLELFCYGTWYDYKDASSSFPALHKQHQSKLKQLTVVSMAEVSKTIPYADLTSQLEISNIRELEDLLISDCFYTGLIKGQLDQRQRCLQVQEAVARDVRAEQLQPIIQGLATWLDTSQKVLASLEAGTSSIQVANQHAQELQAEMEAKLEATKKSLKGDKGDGSGDTMMDDASGTMDFMDLEDRSAHGIGSRPKRRR